MEPPPPPPALELFTARFYPAVGFVAVTAAVLVTFGFYVADLPPWDPPPEPFIPHPHFGAGPPPPPQEAHHPPPPPMPAPAQDPETPPESPVFPEDDIMANPFLWYDPNVMEPDYIPGEGVVEDEELPAIDVSPTVAKEEDEEEEDPEEDPDWDDATDEP